MLLLYSFPTTAVLTQIKACAQSQTGTRSPIPPLPILPSSFNLYASYTLFHKLTHMLFHISTSASSTCNLPVPRHHKHHHLPLSHTPPQDRCNWHTLLQSLISSFGQPLQQLVQRSDTKFPLPIFFRNGSKKRTLHQEDSFSSDTTQTGSSLPLPPCSSRSSKTSSGAETKDAASLGFTIWPQYLGGEWRKYLIWQS